MNINYLGLHKILKKHDKNIPDMRVHAFYANWIHREKWLSGDYSEELVMLSNVFSKIRGDTTGVKNEDSAQVRPLRKLHWSFDACKQFFVALSVQFRVLTYLRQWRRSGICLQGFVRTTRKYWVKSQDVSRVKYTVLQNLPVFQFDANNFHGDAQLVNSVYLDNVYCELYHGRLDKRPDAIAIRLRWYGSGDPSIVFVERKTHREGWKGETSVKERFVLKEANVLPYLNGRFTWEEVSPTVSVRIVGALKGSQQRGVPALARSRLPPHCQCAA